MLDDAYLENLDGMFPDDLHAYAAKLDGLRIPLTREEDQTRTLLARYARYRAHAMGARDNGLIPTAESFELLADRVYRDLPEYARW